MPLRTLSVFWNHIPCVYAAAMGTAISVPVAVSIDGVDWFVRLAMMFGAGGLAAIIIAFTRFKIAGSVVRKTDAETLSGQFVLIVERLQTENTALSNRLESANQREALITVSKHDALKQNQAMIWHIQGMEAAIVVHNVHCTKPFELVPFHFVPLGEILENEDKERTKFATSIKPTLTRT